MWRILGNSPCVLATRFAGSRKCVSVGGRHHLKTDTIVQTKISQHSNNNVSLLLCAFETLEQRFHVDSVKDAVSIGI